MRPIRLTRVQITTELRRSGLPTTGTLDELRRRLYDYLQQHTEELAEMSETKEGMATRSRATTPEPVMVVMEKTDPNRNVDRLRKSGCVTEGKDPYAFLERVAEIQQTYGMTDEELLRGVPEMLRGPAQAWYRNERELIKTWKRFTTEFLAAYSPTRSRFQRERLARERRQRPDEPFIDYMTAVTTLMRRAEMPATERLEMMHDYRIPPRWTPEPTTVLPTQVMGITGTSARRHPSRRRNRMPEVPPEETPGNGGRPVTGIDTWGPRTSPPIPYTGRLLPCVCLWYELPTGRRVEIPLRLIAERRAYVSLPDGTERWTLLFDEGGRLRRCKHRPDAPPAAH